MRIFKYRNLRLAIPNPCNENWAQMDGSGRERFCEKCQSSVVDFPTLTRIEAEHLLACSKGRVCGRIVHNERGDIAFRPDPAQGKLARIAGLSLAGISGLAAQQPTC
jgi:hypothetical protein